MSLTSQCHFLKGFYCFSFSFYAIFCPPFVPLRRFLVKTYIDNQWITFYNTFCIGISLPVLRFLHRNGKRNRRLSGIRQREVFLQGVGGKFLAHTRAVQHAACAVVDERGSIDASFLRVAQHGVDALSFEGGYKLLLVIRAFLQR